MPEVLTLTPLAGYTYGEDTPHVVFMDGAVGQTVRRRIGPTLRRYNLSIALTNSERVTLDAFLRAREHMGTAFYWTDPADHARTAVALGAGNGVKTVFSLPSGETLLDYPINDANAILKVNGTPVSRTVQTDARTITAAVAPAGGTTVTCDYHYCRIVRLGAPLEWTVETGNFSMNTTSLELIEVFED